MTRIDEQSIEKLKEILVSIANAEANEVVRWGREQVIKGKSKIKLSTDLSRAVSSIKLKATGDGIDIDLKLHDKLKAIELYFKICGADNATSDNGGLYIDYGYQTPKGEDDK